jgi:hypothetical protein
MNTSYRVLAIGKEKVAVGVADMDELSNTATLSIHTCSAIEIMLLQYA